MDKRWILFFSFFCIGTVWGQQKRECIANDAQPHDDPNNIYKCDMAQKCCQEQGLPSCCQPQVQSVATWNQIQLWGTLAALIVILALLMWFCRHDGDCCCNRKDGGRYKYCCCGPIIYRDGKGPNPEINDPFYDPNQVKTPGVAGSGEELESDAPPNYDELKIHLDDDDEDEEEAAKLKKEIPANMEENKIPDQ